MVNQYDPDYVNPPGETVEECRLMYEISYNGMCMLLKLTAFEYALLLCGRLALDERLQERLAGIFNIPVSFWKNLNDNYEKWEKGQTQ